MADPRFTIQMSYAITPDGATAPTAEGTVIERDVSADDMLAFEAAQIEVLSARNAGSIAKFAAKK